MSTLAVTTIQAPGGTVPAETVRQGSAKAWLNLNGTGIIAARDSFNVSSVTDNGTGDYTENFTAAMANTGYCITRAGDADSTVNATAVTTYEVLSTLVSSCRLWFGSGATPFDVLRAESAIHGYHA